MTKNNFFFCRFKFLITFFILFSSKILFINLIYLNHKLINKYIILLSLTILDFVITRNNENFDCQ